jgi:CSLREA domain-containing protein
MRGKIATAGFVVGLVFAAFGAAPAAAAVIAPPDVVTDDSTNNGSCSLREAIEIANVNLNPASIESGCEYTGTFSNDTVELGDGRTYTLSIPGVDNTNQSGDLDTDDSAGNSLILRGSSTISAAGLFGQDRVIDVVADRLNIEGATITGGVATGATGDQGGGIRAASPLILTGVTVTGNEADIAGGGIAFVPTGGNRAFELIDSTVSGNIARGETGSHGGGLYLAPEPAVTFSSAKIVNSLISSNHTGDEGGGAWVELPNAGAPDDSTLEISGSRFTGNDVTSPITSPEGGALLAHDGIFEISSSVFDANRSEHTGQNAGAIGGAVKIDSDAAMRIDGSLLHDNHVLSDEPGARVAGGAISNDDGILSLSDSTVSANTLFNPPGSGDQQGGGIETRNGADGVLTLVNSTVSGNSAPETGASPGTGGGIFMDENTVELISSTIAGNVAGGPGDAIAEIDGAVSTVRGSIIAAADGADACTGVIGSGGYNVTSAPACFAAPGPADAQGSDPLLAGLADNGGPAAGGPGGAMAISTQALLPGSPALDRLPAAQCTDDLDATLATDQRGFPRPAGSACDSGAYEAFPCASGPLNAPGPFVGVCPSPATPAPPAAKKCPKGKKLKRVTIKRKGKKKRKKLKCVRKKKGKKKGRK